MLGIADVKPVAEQDTDQSYASKIVPMTQSELDFKHWKPIRVARPSESPETPNHWQLLPGRQPGRPGPAARPPRRPGPWCGADNGPPGGPDRQPEYCQMPLAIVTPLAHWPRASRQQDPSPGPPRPSPWAFRQAAPGKGAAIMMREPVLLGSGACRDSLASGPRSPRAGAADLRRDSAPRASRAPPGPHGMA